MPGRSYTGSGYRYGFNGKEKDDEASGNGNQYDYGFRIYNPRLGKFLSVDPLTKDYPSWTPYAFAMNRVIEGIDLDGLEFFRKTINLFSIGIPTVQNHLFIKSQFQKSIDDFGAQLRAKRASNDPSWYDKGNAALTIYDNIVYPAAVRAKTGTFHTDFGAAKGTFYKWNKVFGKLNRVSGVLGLGGLAIEAYNQGSNMGSEVSFTSTSNKFIKDAPRAQWVSNVVSIGANRGIYEGGNIFKVDENGNISYDVQFLSDLANFSLDGTYPKNATTDYKNLLLANFKKLEQDVTQNDGDKTINVTTSTSTLDNYESLSAPTTTTEPSIYTKPPN